MESEAVGQLVSLLLGFLIGLWVGRAQVLVERRRQESRRARAIEDEWRLFLFGVWIVLGAAAVAKLLGGNWKRPSRGPTRDVTRRHRRPPVRGGRHAEEG